jgi:hypothetical protein
MIPSSSQAGTIFTPGSQARNEHPVGTIALALAVALCAQHAGDIYTVAETKCPDCPITLGGYNALDDPNGIIRCEADELRRGGANPRERVSDGAGGMMCRAHEDVRDVIKFEGNKTKANATFLTVYTATRIQVVRVIKPKDYGNKETWIEGVVLSVPKATRRRHPLVDRHLYLYWKPDRFTLSISADELKALRARCSLRRKPRTSGWQSCTISTWPGPKPRPMPRLKRRSN